MSPSPSVLGRSPWWAKSGAVSRCRAGSATHSRLLRQPPRTRTTQAQPHPPTRSPRLQGHPRTSRLTTTTKQPAHSPSIFGLAPSPGTGNAGSSRSSTTAGGGKGSGGRAGNTARFWESDYPASRHLSSAAVTAFPVDPCDRERQSSHWRLGPFADDRDAGPGHKDGGARRWPTFPRPRESRVLDEVSEAGVTGRLVP